MPDAAAQKALPHRRRGAALSWFGTIGGAVAWAIHLTTVWLTEELACATGTREVAGMSLAAALLVMTVVPGAVIAAALAVSGLAWRRTAAVGHNHGERYDRAAFVAVVGVVANSLFLLIVVYDGVALAVFPPCR